MLGQGAGGQEVASGRRREAWLRLSGKAADRNADEHHASAPL